ncbi:MAG: undecaprenyl-diphosphate phosphatase [Bdellovibrionota bacterium]
MTLIQAIILAVVEGLTEYLPISSTGHMIITSWIMGIEENDFVKNFEVIVQFGAILSVLSLYWRRFLVDWSFYLKLLTAFIPTAVLGFLVKNKIDAILGDVRVVAWALLIGGVILIVVDKYFAKQSAETEGRDEKAELDSLTYVQAAILGVIQCVAFIPGVSRSAATIVGGLGMKLSRKAAAEFSFFLAVPTLTAASAYKLLKILPTIEPDQIPMLVIGNVVSFVVGAITIKAFVGYLSRRGFFAFGVYRIVVGLILLALLMSGQELHIG